MPQPISEPPTRDVSPTRPATAAASLSDRTLRKVRRRILPVIIVMYLIAYLDRNNVGFARVGMEHTLGLNDAAYGLGAGIFFVGYVIMEIPSNAGMYRFGARKWMARILISWGILAVAMAFVVGESSFYILRFLLGAAEAGFFPAVLFYFTLWVPAAHRAGVLGLFVLAQPVANALGSPLSGLLLNLDGTLGLHGWQWMFIVEGIPAVILGVLAPRLLTDRPADARWLARDEREWLTRTMDAENAVKESTSRHPFLAGLKDRRAIAYGLMNLGMVCGIYGLGLWLPSIVGALGTFSNTQLGLLVMLPYAAAIPCVYYWSKRADRTGRRAWHASISMITAAVGLVGAGFLLAVHPILALAFLTIAAIGIYSAVAPFLAMPSAVFAGAAAAAGLGLVNSLGNIGGFVSPYIVGLIKTSTGNTQIALVFLAGCLALTGLIVYRYAHSRPEGNVSAATAPHPSR